MENVIKINPDSHGLYRYIRNVDVSNYPTNVWLHDPDLTNVAGVPEHYWKVVVGSPSTVVEMTQMEKDDIDSEFQDIQNPLTAGTLAFEKNGRCKNKWLGFGSSKASDLTPYVIPCPTKVTALTFTNQNNSADTDIELYKNGIKIHTWEIRDRRFAWKTKGLHKLTFSPGDYMGVFVRDKGTDPKNIIITLHYTAWSHIVGEGGSTTL